MQIVYLLLVVAKDKRSQARNCSNVSNAESRDRMITLTFG